MMERVRTIKVEILGYGSAHGNSSIGTVFVVDERILVEAPPSVAKKLVEKKMDISKIDIVFVSHLHGDHFFGLPLFLLERRMTATTRKLSIYGPHGLEDYVTQMLRIGFPENDYATFFEENGIYFYEVEPGIPIPNDLQYEIIPAMVNHNIEAYGVTIRKNKTIFYSADTSYFDGLVDHIKKSDVCMLDATAYDKELTGHMSFLQIKEIADKYPVKIFYAMHRGNYLAENTPNLKIPNELAHNRFEM